MHADFACEAWVHLSFEALPADVCGHGNLDRQRAAEEVKAVGAMDGTAVQEAVPGEAHAGAAIARLGNCTFRRSSIFRNRLPTSSFLIRRIARRVGAGAGTPQSPTVLSNGEKREHSA